ncbi:MAG: tripartite tricarboxylate transporter substrate binding protein [Betaproteobacteria bacterium]|nr:tripartite tricarboxylate transporter substrate binding protein [Betaproteobacteria bacterium]
MFRSVYSVLVSAVLVLATGAGHAQGFPSKPVRFIVPNAPGGVLDVVARTVGARVSDAIGQPVLVDNRAGASGMIGTELAMKAPPDGYTLLVTDGAIYGINPALHAKLPYDPFRDFTPVTLAAAPPIYLVVNAATAIHSVQDLISLSRQAPIAYGSSGIGNGNHLAMELLKSLTGANLNHVPYKGSGSLAPALLAGDVSAGFIGLTAVLQHAKAGKLRILGIASAQRSSLTPDIPTVAEGGVPKFAIDISVGFVAPANTPRDAVMRMNGEINKALALPDVRQKFEAAGIRAVGTTPEQFGETMRLEAQQLAVMVKAARARVD